MWGVVVMAPPEYRVESELIILVQYYMYGVERHYFMELSISALVLKSNVL
jgi:hypothetical protein